jgi:DnaK suppressor protein
MNAMNGLTHTEIVSLKRKLEKEDVRMRDAMHEQFSQRSVGNQNDVVQYHETTDDDAIIDVLNDMAISNIKCETTSLEAIEKSLHAITSGTYGVCLDCGRHIGVKRLTANPTSNRCTPCQAKHEKNVSHASL